MYPPVQDGPGKVHQDGFETGPVDPDTKGKSSLRREAEHRRRLASAAIMALADFSNETIFMQIMYDRANSGIGKLDGSCKFGF
ncbi:hypothetical protein GCM10009077_08500 [Roseibium denhamense]